MNFSRSFEGEGDYARKDALADRITARVVDVKPNGNLVLEARKFVQNDDEKLELVLTGYCRAEDVTADNSVLSTQMYNLDLRKQHSGELRRASKKGLLTKLLDFVFNF